MTTNGQPFLGRDEYLDVEYGERKVTDSSHSNRAMYSANTQIVAINASAKGNGYQA